MPRIDPLSLLKCLSVLLSPDGGINSREEVPRFVNLMTKFSKKLVSKCVYLLILKSTDVTLIDMFMTSGGWLLIQTWLQEAMGNSNWNLVQEVLELLLITPVDSTRLRLNNIPKLVKTLSKREDLGDVKDMATSLVNNWLAIVKNSTSVIQEEKSSVKSPEAAPITIVEEATQEDKTQESPVETSEHPAESPVVTNEIETIELPEPPAEEPVKMEVEDENTISTSMFYKITIRDGKQVLTKLIHSEEADEKAVTEETEPSEEANKKKDAPKEVEEENKVDAKKDSKSKSSSKSSSSSSSSKKSSTSSKSSSSSSSKDKDKKHSSRHSSKSSSSSREKEKSRKDKENDKDKHRSNGSLKHSSSSSSKSNNSSSSSRSKDKKDPKESKEKQAEKDKDTLEKLKPVTLDKIGRIPRKPTDDKDKEVKKKPSMSIEPKKKGEDRPKTVKIFNSKMRSTGLEEEVKPPPPRSAVKKPPPVIPPITIPTKRLSPPRESLSTPPEKKIKLEVPERIGAIKLIPPKPKRTKASSKSKVENVKQSESLPSVFSCDLFWCLSMLILSEICSNIYSFCYSLYKDAVILLPRPSELSYYELRDFLELHFHNSFINGPPKIGGN